MTNEFDIIARHFAPLATHPGARGLIDDAAVLEITGRLVITTDALIAGEHFLADAPIESAAQKALRVNLSDLAAKGAKPLGVLVALMWPRDRDADEIAAFARGLGADLKLYDVALLGGDTTSTPGPLAISVTALGEPWSERTPARADAKIGEDVWVTGAIGDAFLGWRAQVSDAALAVPRAAADARDIAYLIARYRTPEPRVSFARVIARLAGASIDVSDGLVADAEKIAVASGVALRIEAEAIPISPPARRLMRDLGALITAGDDYEILFTAPLAQRTAVVAAGVEAGLAVTRIGRVEAGVGVSVQDGDGAPMHFEGVGHVHKLGR